MESYEMILLFEVVIYKARPSTKYRYRCGTPNSTQSSMATPQRTVVFILEKWTKNKNLKMSLRRLTSVGEWGYEQQRLHDTYVHIPCFDAIH
jgi:hypothetical protein